MSNRQNGLMTKIWGPPGWLFLHAVTFGFPDNPDDPDHKHRVIHYANFFKSLGHVLPCKYCRESYNEYIREVPIEPFLKSRDKIIEWLFTIHEKVNDKLGVPHCDRPSLDEVKETYEKYRANCKQTTDKERRDKLIKGCTIPENGVKKKCLISVVDDVEKFEGEKNYLYIILSILAVLFTAYTILKVMKRI